MNITKEEIMNLISNSEDLEFCYQFLYELNDTIYKKNIGYVYKQRKKMDN